MTNQTNDTRRLPIQVLQRSAGERTSSLDKTLQWAEKHVQWHLENAPDEDEVVDRIIEEMHREQHRLPREVAEWIVDQVCEGEDGE